MNTVTFSHDDASQLLMRIPGPTWEGEEWTERLWAFQQFLEAQGDQETAAAMAEVLEDFREASETVHSHIIEALNKHGFSV